MPTRKSETASALGRAIIKSREKRPNARKSKKADDDGGYIDSKSKQKVAKSILEENDLDEFLAKADLAGTNFEAEHMNVKFISVDDNKLIEANKKEEMRTIEEAQEKLKYRLRIPRRPTWTTDTSPNELQTLENRSFLEWRRELAALEQEEHALLTPFERNLEVWRQLWRVIERSDIVVQIVDARNPLLFRCRDLESYVKEIGADKVNFILINKADLLSPKQRLEWARYFRQEGIPVAFWSAAMVDEEWSQTSTNESSDEHAEEDAEKTENEVSKEPQISDKDGQSTESDLSADDDDDEENWESASDDGEDNEEKSWGEVGGESDFSANRRGGSAVVSSDGGKIVNRTQLLDLLRSFRPDEADRTLIIGSDDGRIVNRTQLLDLFRSFRPDKADHTLNIGMVGYPNVGKSSTINKLIGQKKVAVSATPGKTKHFQTLFIDDQTCLCDCPGLVMPSFAISKEQMIVNGILPCDEMRDGTPAVGLICSQIDRRVFERTYGIILPKPGEYDAPDRKPTPHELLTAYAFVRGFMSTKGIPDSSRAARIIIKDFVNGRLRYCTAPPDMDQAMFNGFEENQNVSDVAPTSRNETLAVLRRRHLLDEKPKTSDVDRTFFKEAPGAIHVKSAKKATSGPESDRKHHNNRNKKEKLRRVYGYLDA